MPRQWYNLRADMKQQPDPIIHPARTSRCPWRRFTRSSARNSPAAELDSTTRYFDIPDAVREMYKLYRPSPLCRAYNLEKALDTPAKIYYKFEGNNTSGSHKLNSAIAQAYYAKEQGSRA